MKITDPEFTCGHCRARVSPWPSGDVHNSCPVCQWSRHVVLGVRAGKPPCGGLMRPHERGDGLVTHRCLGCGFVMTGPTEQTMTGIRAGTHPPVTMTIGAGGLAFTADLTAECFRQAAMGGAR